MTYCVYKPSTNEIFEIAQNTTFEKILERMKSRGSGLIIYQLKEDGLSELEYQKMCAIKTINMLADLNNIKVAIEE